MNKNVYEQNVPKGDVAQLVERVVSNDEAQGSKLWYRPMLEIADSSDLCEEEYEAEEEEESVKTQA